VVLSDEVIKELNGLKNGQVSLLNDIEVYRDAFRLAERIIARPELPLRKKLKDLLDESDRCKKWMP